MYHSPDGIELLDKKGATAAYRMIHKIIRDAWEEAGAKVVLTDGTELRARIPDLPVRSWFDEEAASALREYNELRTKCQRARPASAALRGRCAIARQRYRRLKQCKQRCFAQEWVRFWADVRCNHVSVWGVIRRLNGGGCGPQCACSETVQRSQYTTVASIRDLTSYDKQAALRAAQWLESFLPAACGI